MKKLVKFTVVPMLVSGLEAWQIVAHYEDGTNMIWGQQKTERGVKACMTRYAKQKGLTVHKSSVITEIYAD